MKIIVGVIAFGAVVFGAVAMAQSPNRRRPASWRDTIRVSLGHRAGATRWRSVSD